jgi:hypothetical protein
MGDGKGAIAGIIGIIGNPTEVETDLRLVQGMDE